MIQLFPPSMPANLDAALDPNHETHAEFLEQGEQLLIGKAPIGSEPDSSSLHILKDQFNARLMTARSYRCIRPLSTV